MKDNIFKTSFNINFRMQLLQNLFNVILLYFEYYMILKKYILLLSLCIWSVLNTSEYRVVSQTKSANAVVLLLEYTGKADFYLKPSSPIVRHLNFTLQTLTFDEFAFKITDVNRSRFEVPQGAPFPEDPYRNFSFPLLSSAIAFEYAVNPFDFQIVRKQNGAVLFSTFNRTVIYSDYYIEIGTQLQSRFLFGLGERLAQSFIVREGKWTMFNRDRGEQIDHGEGIQTYSYYPFYLIKERSGLFHISYYRTSSALDAIKQNINETDFLSYKSIGGIVDFRFFLGDSNPQTVIEKFNFYNGRADLPPFWSFGYHQCRWGYADIGQLRAVISNFQKHGIPLDTLWSDLDYMVNSEVFTIDETKFPLAEMRDLLKEYRWVPIIDPGIKNSGPFYEEGLKRSSYILDANTKQPFVGKMRVGQTVYPDFFHPNASQYWKDMLDILYQKVPFSGLWLDSNEFTSFCEGRCQPPSTPSIFDYGADLPYSPGMDNLQGDMPSLNSTHYGNLIEADVHIYNGLLQSAVTYDYLKSKGSHPFILTRSSTLGSSKFAIHWTGDNSASWQFLRSSISDNFNNQLWGSQVVGADICGFAGNTTDQLCARWYQLGSFYPFSRNHNQKSSKSQQPYALGQMTLSSAKLNLKFRYKLLKYIYTIFVAKKGLGTIWKPLFFVFPDDANLYFEEFMQTQFMLGMDLLFIPLLEEGRDIRQAYFPKVNWYKMSDGSVISPGNHIIQNLPSQLIPVFIRQGAIIFTQDTATVTKTSQLSNVFSFTAGMKFEEAMSNITTKVFSASGSILSISDLNDDYLVSSCLTQNCFYNFVSTLVLESSQSSLQVDVIYSGGTKLNQEIVINGFSLYFNRNKIEQTIEPSIKINGPAHFTIPLTTNLHIQTS